ncbi:sigma 54-interacting transcriptional regulator, partial [Allorhizobium undicola]|uniref:sigma 54-interacting transcriptional regulator n=1 Tax=Allorhizobium undicola TaxID=78527 RepID=UPI003D354D1C
MPKRPSGSDSVTLRQVSEAAASPMLRGDFRQLASGASPTWAELADALHFSLGDGRIWLNDQRMVLIQSQVLGRLRQEIIDAFGMETAKGIFMRVGYMQGVRDAELVMKRFPDQDLTHALAAGPRMHTLEGFVKVVTRHFEFDREKGFYHGEFHWHDSSEAAEHLSHHGLSAEPVCWMQAGYPTGYTSTLFGRPVLFRETECLAMGAAHCVVIGKNAEEWEADAPEKAYLGLQWKARHSAPSTSAPAASPLNETVKPERDEVVGVSARFLTARLMVEKVADTQATVLLVGESGVGKEVFAQQIHRLSSRARGPFLPVNCAAIPENLVESELFGVERGAFTGAVASRPGTFERANGGTLFLDEVASLAYAAQGKLLRAIQERKLERVGGTRLIETDVRIIAASNVDLAEEVRAGRFRQDLYFRLCVFPITIPPLRERRDDLPLLADHFLRQFRLRHGRHVRGLTRRAMDALLAYDFPGNIRELQNMIERGVIFAEPDGQIDLQHLFTGSETRSAKPENLALNRLGRIDPTGLQTDYPENLRKSRKPEYPAQPRETALEELTIAENRLFAEALAQSGGNLSAAARHLGISRAKLEYRMRKAGLL